MKRFVEYIANMNRSLLIAYSFLIVIAIGTGLLMLPMASVNGESLPFIDALFTATSASCVTGLIVVDTGTHFTRFGQTIIILLIQIGGLGLMTMTTIFTVGLGKHLGFRTKLLMQEYLNQDDQSSAIFVLKRVVTYTFCIEVIFGVMLTCYFYQYLGIDAAYLGFWQAISAFCNAGFDLFGNYNSLTKFVDNPFINLTFMVIIILGGIGFTVISDIGKNAFNWREYKLHTKLVLIINFVLIFGGAIMFWITEHSNVATMADMDMETQIWVSLFQSVTARTAGFNTIDLAHLNSATYVLMMILMLIGASPTSTGGGLKTTTVAAMVLSTIALLRDEHEVVVFGRRIDQGLINKALSIITLAILWMIVAFFLLLALDTAEHDFRLVLFELCSAMGTVGLGVGITSEWNIWCKLVLIATMFIGRIGILTFGMSLISKRKERVRYPSENILIG